MNGDSEDFDLEIFEEELTTLPGVRAARVVTTTGGRISEIHLVAEGGKAPKQLVRDVQTIALAKFDLRIDHRIVSVVHFGDDPIPVRTPPSRPDLATLSWTTDGVRTTCRVEVDTPDGLVMGEAAGGATSRSRPRLAAAATLDALHNAKVVDVDTTLDVADVLLTDLSERRVALVMLVRLRDAAEELLLGSALVRSDEPEAVARATLNAFNHRLGTG